MKNTSDNKSNLLTVGRITGVFGVKGWLKVKSYTDPIDNIAGYSKWWLKTKHGVKPVEVSEFKCRPQGLVVHFKGVDDRDVAADYAMVDIAIERADLESLPSGEFYWDQLVGMRVISRADHDSVTEYELGTVSSLIETGANDVLVIQPTDQSIDDQERLVPYVPDIYVESVNLDEKLIRVIWDSEF